MAHISATKARTLVWEQQRSGFRRTRLFVMAALLIALGFVTGYQVSDGASLWLRTFLGFERGVPAIQPVINEPVSVLTADASRQSAVLVADPTLGVIRVHLLNLPGVSRAHYTLWSVNQSGEQAFLGNVAEDGVLTLPIDAFGENSSQLLVTLEPSSTEIGTRAGPLILSGQIDALQ